MKSIIQKSIFTIMLCFLFAEPVNASPKGYQTGLDIPRFVSLSSDLVYGRSGPGRQYPVKWEYKQKNLPVEIMREYEHWRKIRDPDGAEIWVHKTLLSGKRYGIVVPEAGYEYILMYKESTLENKAVSAKLGKKLNIRIEKCNKISCKVHVSGYKGWIKRKFIWGIYPQENID